MYRIQGTVKQVQFSGKIFGIVVGDDGFQYFFIPSLFRSKPQFWTLKTGWVLEFIPSTTERGLRAEDITVLFNAQRGSDGGEEILVSK